MASETIEPHFVILPLLTPGHVIPMIDIAKLLAQRNVLVTIATTPQNAATSIISRAANSGLPIRFLQLEIPLEAGLPKGCESFGSLPSMDLLGNLFTAIKMLQQTFEKSLREMDPPPSCIIADKHIAWTAEMASQFRIPRILFDAMSCFTLLVDHNLHKSEIYKHVTDTEPFVVPGLPHRIEFTKAQLPGAFNPGKRKELTAFRQQYRASEGGAYGMLVNSFEELEPEYVGAYREATGQKVWCIGPVSLCNKESSDKAERGNSASIDKNKCLEWLDSRLPGSVIYVCFGSINFLTPLQQIEIGLALEASNKNFIWVIRGVYKPEETEKWLTEYRFEERVKGRGLLIRGWSPQILILSHPAIGGFLTHCGWNSTLEGISAGMPMVTWPLITDQFHNEKLIVNVLNIGVSVGNPYHASPTKNGFSKSYSPLHLDSSPSSRPPNSNDRSREAFGAARGGYHHHHHTNKRCKVQGNHRKIGQIRAPNQSSGSTISISGGRITRKLREYGCTPFSWFNEKPSPRHPAAAKACGAVAGRDTTSAKLHNFRSIYALDSLHS